MNLIKNLTVITLATAMGYGCSSSSSTPPPTPNGIYTGTVIGGIGLGNGLEKGIIYNNRFMVFSTSFNIQQLFDSVITVTDTSFSGNVSNYDNSNAPKRFTADLSGTFVQNTSVAASFTNFSQIGFTDGTITLSADSTLYNKGSSATTVSSSWQGSHGDSSTLTSLTIDATGTITSGSDDQGCNFTGSVIPADVSINVYNVTIVSTGGTGCTSLPPATYTGLAWTEGATDATLNFTVSDGINSRSVILTKNG